MWDGDSELPSMNSVLWYSTYPGEAGRVYYGSIGATHTYVKMGPYRLSLSGGMREGNISRNYSWPTVSNVGDEGPVYNFDFGDAGYWQLVPNLEWYGTLRKAGWLSGGYAWTQRPESTCMGSIVIDDNKDDRPGWIYFGSWTARRTTVCWMAYRLSCRRSSQR